MDTYVYSDKDREEDFPTVSDETTHYMESTSRLRGRIEELDAMLKASDDHAQFWEVEAERLRAENEELRGELGICNRQRRDNLERAGAAEATMREVAEELRRGSVTARKGEGPGWEKVARGLDELADRLDPPPVGATDE